MEHVISDKGRGTKRPLIEKALDTTLTLYSKGRPGRLWFRIPRKRSLALSLIIVKIIVKPTVETRMFT